jgi:uncharacterized protein YndB with AHSA1/START domain
MSSTFNYVIYIRGTPDAVWTALTDAEYMKRYWFGMHCDSTWTAGAAWTRFSSTGQIVDDGEIIAAEPSRRLAINWRHQLHAELAAEGASLCTMCLSPVGDAVKLSISHSIERENSKLIAAVSEGWPKVAANLKSVLETGSAVIQMP